MCIKAEPDALRSRSWKGVKDFVRNRITALQNAKKQGANDPKALTSAKIAKHCTAQQQTDLDGIRAVPILGPNSQAQTQQQGSGLQQHGIQINPHGKIFFFVVLSVTARVKVYMFWIKCRTDKL